MDTKCRKKLKSKEGCGKLAFYNWPCPHHVFRPKTQFCAPFYRVVIRPPLVSTALLSAISGSLTVRVWATRPTRSCLQMTVSHYALRLHSPLFIAFKARYKAARYVYVVRAFRPPRDAPEDDQPLNAVREMVRLIDHSRPLNEFGDQCFCGRFSKWAAAVAMVTVRPFAVISQKSSFAATSPSCSSLLRIRRALDSESPRIRATVEAESGTLPPRASRVEHPGRATRR